MLIVILIAFLQCNVYCIDFEIIAIITITVIFYKYETKQKLNRKFIILKVFEIKIRFFSVNYFIDSSISFYEQPVFLSSLVP